MRSHFFSVDKSDHWGLSLQGASEGKERKELEKRKKEEKGEEEQIREEKGARKVKER